MAGFAFFFLIRFLGCLLAGCAVLHEREMPKAKARDDGVSMATNKGTLLLILKSRA